MDTDRRNLITPYIIQRELAYLLGEENWNRVNVVPRFGCLADAFPVEFCYRGETKEASYSVRDLALNLQDFSDKFLAPLAEELKSGIKSSSWTAK